MGNLAIIPTRLARDAAAARNPRNASTCGIFDIAGRLGQANRGFAYICRTLDVLIAQRGFPAPYPLVKAGKLAERVYRDSRWHAAAVEAWFLDQLPPEAQAIVGAAERVEIDSRLNTNLSHLFESVA